MAERSISLSIKEADPIKIAWMKIVRGKAPGGKGSLFDYYRYWKDGFSGEKVKQLLAEGRTTEPIIKGEEPIIEYLTAVHNYLKED